MNIIMTLLVRFHEIIVKLLQEKNGHIKKRWHSLSSWKDTRQTTELIARVNVVGASTLCCKNENFKQIIMKIYLFENPYE